jgi:apolipoprotein N-acyltransferase
MGSDLAPALDSLPIARDRAAARGAAFTALAAGAVALASAAVYALAFPPQSLWPLAWLALAPFFAACAAGSAGRGAALGLLWGAAITVFTAPWMPAMLRDFFGVPGPRAWLAFAGVAVFLVGLFYAGFGAWLGFVTRRRGRPPSPLAVGCAWCACEWARGALTIPSPWALSGYSQVHWPAVAQVADLAGPYGIAFLLAAVNACLAFLAVPALRPRRPRVTAAATALLLAATAGYGHARLAETFGEGDPIPIAVVQAAPVHGERWGESQRAANLERHLALTRRAVEQRPALVLWPEFAIDFYLREQGPETRALLAGLRDAGASVLLGGPDWTLPPTADRELTEYTNSVFLVERGQVVASYDKVELTPFSETNPLRGIAAVGIDLYTAGAAAQPLDSPAGPLGVFICSEGMLPHYVRRLVRAGAEVLVNPSNDDWFGDAGAARQQLELVSLRAIESRRFLVRATPSGVSAVIDPHGRVRASLATGASDVLHATVVRSRATTLYQESGDAAPAAATGVAAIAALHAAARPRRGPAGAPATRGGAA